MASIFFNSALEHKYGYFVASLLNLTVEPSRSVGNALGLKFKTQNPPTTSYSVVTLNYDLVLENFASFFNDRAAKDQKIGFAEVGGEKTQANVTAIAKLHGSVATKKIVPPTWNKSLHPQSTVSWRQAFELLKQANHIRIIGYSLPTADSYVKYLLKAAAIHAPHLKSVDILCLDNNGEVKARYDEFIDFYKYRFVSGSVVDYLGCHNEILVKPYEQHYTQNLNKDYLSFDKLEQAHEEFFGNFKQS